MAALDNYTRIYARGQRVAHLAFGTPVQDSTETLCGQPVWRFPHGGSDVAPAEKKHADDLPTCDECRARINAVGGAS